MRPITVPRSGGGLGIVRRENRRGSMYLVEIDNKLLTTIGNREVEPATRSRPHRLHANRRSEHQLARGPSPFHLPVPRSLFHQCNFGQLFSSDRSRQAWCLETAYRRSI